MASEPRKRNSGALEVFSGEIPTEPIIHTIEPEIVKVHPPDAFRAGETAVFLIEFNQRVRDLTMADIELSVEPSSLKDLFTNGRVAGNNEKTYNLIYDIPDNFDPVTLPEVTHFSIVIKAGSIEGEGS